MSSENGSDSPSRDRNSDFSGDRVCRDFLRKVCRRGSRCKYVHPNEKEQDTGRELFTNLVTRTVICLVLGNGLYVCLDCVKKKSALMHFLCFLRTYTIARAKQMRVQIETFLKYQKLFIIDLILFFVRCLNIHTYIHSELSCTAFVVIKPFLNYYISLHFTVWSLGGLGLVYSLM